MEEKNQLRNAGAATGRHSEGNLPQPSAGETGRQPYEAPAVEVIEVQTERGYAGSIDPWEPAGW